MSSVTRIVDLIIPDRCVVCGQLLSGCRNGPPPVCAACTAGLLPLSGPRCLCCGVPLISEETRCLACRDRQRSYATHRSIYVYDATMAALIGAFKSRGVKPVSAFLASALWREWVQFGSGSVVVPVPGDPAGVRRRGWDHCLVIAARLSRQYNVPVCRCLNRSRGKRQKDLGYEDRQKNLAGRITVQKNGARCTGDRVILIDDVYTTGATVEECARVLLQHGARRVDALTVAMDL